MNSATAFRAAVAISIVAAAASSMAFGADAPRSQESPWAMRAPAEASPEPQAAATAAAASSPVAASLPAGAANPAAASSAPAAQPSTEVVDVTEVKITPDQREFAEKLIKVVNDENLPAFKQMVAPKSVACLQRDEYKPFFEAWCKKQLRYVIPDAHKLKMGKLPVGVSDDNKFNTYPAQATHILEIQYTTSAGSTVTFNRMIAKDQGKWYQVAPCPTAIGLARWKKLDQQKAARRDKAREVFSQLKDPVKSQLLDLIAKGNRAGAWKLCMRTQHVDFLVAQQVVDQLAGKKLD